MVLAAGCSGPEQAPPDSETVQKKADLPKTVAEAVEFIVGGMPLEDQARLRAVRRDDLINNLHDWGRGIRNAFQLWGGNPALLKDCGTESAEGASLVIMGAVWDRVQRK